MYRYRCEQCAVETEPLPDVGALYAARERHRREGHSGLIPDGERLSYRAERRPPPDWRVAAAVIVLGAIGLIGAIIHHL